MSNMGILETIEDVLDRLISLDYEIGESNEVVQEKLGFIIFGGTALLLYNNSRMTSDIDIILLGNIDLNKGNIKEILKNHSVVPNNAIIQYPYLKEVISRAVPINAPFENIEVSVTSKEDLALSKIFSSRPEDERDLIHTNILDEADIEIVRKRYDEYLPNYLGGLGFLPDLDMLLRLRDEFKKEQIVL
ncbi:DUF6036 family nucleotidyltransferase [Fictibacillus norfolkensis]|uniref:DUF6036 domain-containing protein n=1 Tax=Fictibacillus norfolkensis TaxID=2762233 RepID=A0ABR8SPH6_9BACL|nr:DUF6036 family nucleotidyltransferase [Fictibacillus norfolkensis]MBD7965394.1 hypothetical protein [Fictibacillus norfolkensis]